MPVFASMPKAAIAIPYSPAKWYAPTILPAIIKMGPAVDCMPTPSPAIMFVAGPVNDCREIESVGEVLVPV